MVVLIVMMIGKWFIYFKINVLFYMIIGIDINNLMIIKEKLLWVVFVIVSILLMFINVLVIIMVLIVD